MVCDHNKLLEPKKKKKKKFTHGLKFKDEQCMLANLKNQTFSQYSAKK